MGCKTILLPSNISEIFPAILEYSYASCNKSRLQRPSLFHRMCLDIVRFRNAVCWLNTSDSVSYPEDIRFDSQTHVLIILPRYCRHLSETDLNHQLMTMCVTICLVRLFFSYIPARSAAHSLYLCCRMTK